MKKILCTVCTFVLVYFFISCKPAFFKTIKLKASPTFRVNLGTKEFKTEDYLSSKLINQNADDDEFKQRFRVFDYKLADGTEGLLLYYPITETDLDISKELDVLKNTENGFSSALGKREFTVPKISKEKTETVTADKIGTLLLDAVNHALSVSPMLPVVPAISPMPVEIPVIDLSAVFSTITFKQGSAFSLTGIDGSVAEVEKLTLKHGTTSEEIASAHSASVDISNKELPAKIKVEAVFRIKKAGSVSVKPMFSGTIKKAAGLNISTSEIPVNEMTVPLNGSAFKEAEIRESELKVFTATTAGLSGFKTEYQFTAQQTGGLDASVTQAAPSQDLGGKTINGEDIKVGGRFKLSAVNADFLNEKNESVSLTVKLDIKKFAHIKFKTDGDFKRTQKLHRPLPRGLKDWVDTIRFKKAGIKLKLDNGLPAGNDITVKLVSNAFGINSEKTYPSADTHEQEFSRNNFDFKPAAHSELDFEVKTEFAGYDEAEKLLTLSNVEPGKTVSFGGETAVLLDWEYLIAKPKGGREAFAGAYPAKDGDTMNLRKFGKYRDMGIKLNNIRAHVYVNGDVFERNGSKIGAYMYVDYKDAMDQPKKKLLTGSDNPADPFEELKFVPPLPEFFSKAGKKSGVYEGALPEASETVDLTELVNMSPAGVKLKYNLKLNEIKIEKEKLEAAKKSGGTKLKVDLLIEVPMDFDAEPRSPGEKYIVAEHINSSGDAFGRSSPDNLQLKQFLENVKRSRMNIEFINMMGLDVKAVLFDKNNEAGFKREFSVSRGSGLTFIEFGPDDIDYLRKTVPLNLDIKILIPKGHYKIQKDSGIVMKAYFTTDIEIDKEFSL